MVVWLYEEMTSECLIAVCRIHHTHLPLWGLLYRCRAKCHYQGGQLWRTGWNWPVPYHNIILAWVVLTNIWTYYWFWKKYVVESINTATKLSWRNVRYFYSAIIQWYNQQCIATSMRPCVLRPWLLWNHIIAMLWNQMSDFSPEDQYVYDMLLLMNCFELWKSISVI